MGSFQKSGGASPCPPSTAFALIGLADAPKPVHPRDAQVPTAFKDSDRGIVPMNAEQQFAIALLSDPDTKKRYADLIGVVADAARGGR